MNQDKPFFIMLSGLPCSGKTRFISTELVPYLTDAGIYAEVLTTDAVVDYCAAIKRKTYSEVFKDVISPAQSIIEAQLQLTSYVKGNIILDQTNLTYKTRGHKLNLLRNRDEYHTICITFPIEEDVLAKRLLERTASGKVIGQEVIEGMQGRMEPVTELDGFTDFLTVDEFRSKYMPKLLEETTNA